MWVATAVTAHRFSTSLERIGRVLPDLFCKRALTGLWPHSMHNEPSACSNAPSPRRNRPGLLRALTALRDELDALERHQVGRALREGKTFTAIAQPLGISRQAAHRRYRDLHAQPTLSPEARSALVRAREEAARHGSHSIDGQHLLLALAGSGALSLDVDAARSSFAPPAINATAPAGLHPSLARAPVAHARAARARAALARGARGAGRAPVAGALRSQSSSLLTVAQLRTVAVPARPGLPSAFISLEFCIPSGHHA